MTSRIIVCGCCFAPDDPGLAGLRRDGHWVQRCTKEENLLDHVIEFRPSAVVYHVMSSADLGILRLLRRVAPSLPLVLVTEPAPLHEQRALQALRPTFVAVAPADTDELVEAIRSAIGKARHPAA